MRALLGTGLEWADALRERSTRDSNSFPSARSIREKDVNIVRRPGRRIAA